MVTFLTITLLVSCAGMVITLALKERELRTGRMFFAGSRPAMGQFFGRVLVLEHALPTAARSLARRVGQWAQGALHRAVAWGVVVVERLLEKTLHLVRYKTSAPKAEGEASPFLREVAEYKKQLLEDTGEHKTE